MKKKPFYIVTLVPGLPPELHQLFEGVLHQFDNGYFYMLATRVEISGCFVVATLEDNDTKLRSVWLQAAHVLAVGAGDFDMERMGFRC